MGLFDIFKKKECCICGNEVGLIGNRKLADGNMCSKCTKKLSPWFEDRRESTVEQIKAQLAYREQNAKELESFEVSRVIGEAYKIYIEEIKDIPIRFFVTDATDYREANPDIISFKDVISCVTDIEVRDEEMKQRDNEGKMVSYNPPRYKHHHNFYIKMQIRNNPYFDDIKFYVNRGVVTLESVGGFENGVASAFLRGAGVGNTRFGTGTIHDAQEQRRYNEYQQMCQIIEQAVADGKYGVTKVEQSVESDAIMDLIEQIRNAPDRETVSRLQQAAITMSVVSPREGLTDQIVQAVTEATIRLDYKEAGIPYTPLSQTAESEAPKPRVCPSCGAHAEGGKFCQSCGSPL